MGKKLLVTFFVIAGVSAILFTAYQAYKLQNEALGYADPLESAKKEIAKVVKTEPPAPSTIFSKDKVFNIMLMGSDRRSKAEPVARTDIMILLSVNPAKKTAVMTSVPRDLWVGGGRVNALYSGGGWETIQSSFETITGMKPDAYILCDFEDFVWIVDAFGGLDINLERGFTDAEYPNDVTKTWMTVSFNAGPQHIDGRTALILARSRHGNNGEGSDFSRQKRQWLMLKAMPEAILSDKSTFKPFDIKTFYEAVTAPTRVSTNLTIGDAQFLWGFYSERDQYKVDTFSVDSTYLYNPPMSEYGGAWVLVPISNDYTPVHRALQEKLGLIETAPAN